MLTPDELIRNKTKLSTALVNWLESQKAEPGVASLALVDVVAAMLVQAAESHEDILDRGLGFAQNYLESTTLAMWRKQFRRASNPAMVKNHAVEMRDHVAKP